MLDPQVFAIVHTNELIVPAVRLPTVVVGLLAEAIVPVPPASDQLPVPLKIVAGAFPVSKAVGVLAHMVWFGVAFGVVGVLCTVTLICETFAGHTPLFTIHW